MFTQSEGDNKGYSYSNALLCRFFGVVVFVVFFGCFLLFLLFFFAYYVLPYRSKTPTFYDELRVCLPHALTSSTHFLFSFYHLKFKQKQDASRSSQHSSLAAGTASVQFQQLNEVTLLRMKSIV